MWESVRFFLLELLRQGEGLRIWQSIGSLGYPILLLNQQPPRKSSEARKEFYLTVTKQPAGKWIELGNHHCYPDKNGKILASIFVGAKDAIPAPYAAYVGSKDIGRYISPAAARKACDRALGSIDPDQEAALADLIARVRHMREAADDVLERTSG